MPDYIAVPLAGWAIAHLLTQHTGPFGVFELLRFKAGAGVARCMDQRKAGVTNVLCCWECLAVWVVPMVYGLWVVEPIAVQVIAFVGLAWIIGRGAKWLI